MEKPSVRLFGLSSILAFAMVFCGDAVTAETYYVDAASGNDTNSGRSPERAWQTLARINESRFSPGDTILFKRGGAWRGNLIIRSSGTVSKPITFGAFGQGDAPSINAEGKDYGVQILTWNMNQPADGRGHLVFENLDVRKAKVQAFRLFGYYPDLKNITIRNCSIQSEGTCVYVTGKQGEFHVEGLVIEGCTLTPNTNGLWNIGINFVFNVSNFKIVNNTIHPAGEDGIMIDNDCFDGIIRGNTLGGNYENSIDVKNSHDIVIAENTCTFDQEPNIVIHDAPGIFYKAYPTNKTYSIIVERNKCFQGGQGKTKDFIPFGIFAFYVDDCTIRYNWVEEAYGSGIWISDMESSENNNRIYGNLVLNCGKGLGRKHNGGIIIGNCVGTRVFSNTIYNQSGYGISVIGGHIARDIQVKNNIVHTAGAGLISVLAEAHSGFVSDHNCFYPDGSTQFYWADAHAKSFAEWQTRTGQDAHSICADPQFTDIAGKQFILRSGSPCIDAGVLIPNFNDDFTGAAPDMGAHEAGTPPTEFGVDASKSGDAILTMPSFP